MRFFNDANNDELVVCNDRDDRGSWWRGGRQRNFNAILALTVRRLLGLVYSSSKLKDCLRVQIFSTLAVAKKRAAPIRSRRRLSRDWTLPEDMAKGELEKALSEAKLKARFHTFLTSFHSSLTPLSLHSSLTSLVSHSSLTCLSVTCLSSFSHCTSRRCTALKVRVLRRRGARPSPALMRRSFNVSWTQSCRGKTQLQTLARRLSLDDLTGIIVMKTSSRISSAFC